MKRFLGNFFGSKNSFRAASLILIVTLFLSNVLGVVRDHYLSQKIPTDILSVYYAAFRIPDLIFNVLVLGAISSAFIPIFSSLLAHKKDKEAWEVANSVINTAIILLIIACAILVTVKLARIMLASPIFFGFSYIFGAVLNSSKRFVVYSFAPLIYNVSIILGTLFLSDRIGVVGVSLAVVAGAFLHMLIQIPVVIKLGWRWQALLDWKNAYVRRIGILMVPRAIGLGANQILLLVFTGIASSLSGSAVAIYNLADNIQTMPMVVFGTSFAMAIFPTLAEKYAQKDYESFDYFLNKTLRSILFFMVPIVFGVILLRAQIVRLILGSGFFGWQQTIDTANTLGYFAIALVFTSIIPLFARAFYALHNTKTPMVITIITVIVSIVAGKFLSASMGITGLALAYSIGSFINAVLLYLILRTKIKITEGKIIIFLIKIIIATVIMAVAIQELKLILAIFVDMRRFWGVFLQTLGATIGGGLIYILLAWIFGCEEIASVKVIFAKLTGRSLAEQTNEPGR
ncbi:MAG: integral rane protein MviN, virulence factor [Candidatus Berkelbacteria bacterium]|nr:integral rane protein MviN, virulence factor [Candidatus Berkelbacteria bacterium]